MWGKDLCQFSLLCTLSFAIFMQWQLLVVTTESSSVQNLQLQQPHYMFLQDSFNKFTASKGLVIYSRRVSGRKYEINERF